MNRLAIFPLLCLCVLAAYAVAQAPPKPPLRLGVVGYEGHGLLFTKELNSGLGAKIGLVVTHVWHREAIPREDQGRYAFSVVAAPGDMIGKVDGVFIAEALPFRYPELAAPFIKAGVRTFLNRPLAATAREAAELLRLGRQSGNPIQAASALAIDPAVLKIRQERAQFAPLKVVNVTGPSNHFWNYLPHLISALVGALGVGVEEVQALDLALGADGITIQNPLLVFFRYSLDSEVGPVRGTLQMVPGDQPGDWYGFRMKLFGRRESPDFELFRTPEGESAWMPTYRLLIDFFGRGIRPLDDRELLEVPLVLDMVRKSGSEGRPVLRSEYRDVIALIH